MPRMRLTTERSDMKYCGPYSKLVINVRLLYQQKEKAGKLMIVYRIPLHLRTLLRKRSNLKTVI
jgi:hypothetical protein